MTCVKSLALKALIFCTLRDFNCGGGMIESLFLILKIAGLRDRLMLRREVENEGEMSVAEVWEYAGFIGS